MTELYTHAAAEHKLQTEFTALVGRLALPELVAAHPYVPGAGQDACHEPLEDFALWPVLPSYNLDDSEWPPSTLDPARYDYSIPSATAPHCIHIDAEHAVAVGFLGHVAGYAAAGITEEGTLLIMQLQGSAPDEVDPVAARGRRGGFLWTDVLVEAWAEIGRHIGLGTIEILSPAAGSCAHGNGPEHVEQILRKYTYTAQRLGFDPPTRNRHWRRSL